MNINITEETSDKDIGKIIAALNDLKKDREKPMPCKECHGSGRTKAQLKTKESDIPTIRAMLRSKASNEEIGFYFDIGKGQLASIRKTLGLGRKRRTNEQIEKDSFALGAIDA